MGHSQAEKAQSRERILDAAARQIREVGLDGVSIAELMKSANLTHGGFYGHFPSRAALIEAALERAMDNSEATFVATRSSKAPGSVKSIVNSYLSPAHRDNVSGGCAVATLAGEVGRSDDEALRAQMTQRIDRYLERMTKAMGGGQAAEAAALTAWSTMIGALVLSRVMQDDPRGAAILKEARSSILDLETRTRDAEA